MAKVKAEKKDEKYHKDWILRSMNNSVGRYSYIKTNMARCINYFHGKDITPSPYNSLFSAFEINGNAGTVSTSDTQGNGQNVFKLPLVFTSFNNIRNKIQKLEGDLIDMGFRADVEAINAEAKKRKDEFKIKTLTQMSLKPIMEQAAAETGIEFGINNELPENPEEFEKYMRMNYKDLTELVMEACLNYSLEYYNYVMVRLELFRDVIITGECHAYTKIANGTPMLGRYNPLTVYYPTNPNDDEYLTKSNAMIVMYYATVAEVMKEYNLTNEQIEDIKTRYKNREANMYFGLQYNSIWYLEPFDKSLDLVLVTKCEWMDDTTVMGVTKKDKYGNEWFEAITGPEAEERYEITPEERQDGVTVKVERKKVACNRRGTLIAGEILKDWGVCDYQLRDYNKPELTWFETTSYRPYYMNGYSTSNVMVISKIQDFVDYIWTKLQLEITKSGGSAIAIDVAKLPQDWGDAPTKMRTFLYYLKGMGVAVYNSSQGEVPMNNQGIPFDRVDMGLSSAISGYLSIISILDNKMDVISGATGPVMGEIANNQLKSVTDAAISQANKMSKALFLGFTRFESKLLTKHAQHIKMMWVQNPERYSNIIGDFYMNFLQIDADITLDDHAVRVVNNPISGAELKEYLVYGIQHGLPLQRALALEIQFKDNPSQAVYDFIAKMDEIDAKNAEMQQMQQQMALQAAQAQNQSKIEGKMAEIDAINQGTLQKQQMKGEQDLKKTSMKEQSKAMQERAKLVAKGMFPPM
jgi:hypothetical protein